MRDEVKTFFADMHERYFKPHGFSKKRLTFSRALDDYTERIQFQGSAWNDSTGPWTFYINVGIEFHGIRVRTAHKGFPDTHCSGRIEGIVKTAPAQFNLTRSGAARLARQIDRLLDKARKAIGRKHQAWKKAFLRTRCSIIELL